MANIDNYLNAIRNATYGREVRSSIVNAIDAINDESEATREEIDEFIEGELDTTLTSTVLPAQGKAVGDAVNGLKSQITEIENRTVYLNLFNGKAQDVVGISINASTLRFTESSTAKSIVFKCDPNTIYSVAWKSSSGNARFFIGTSSVLPVVGEYASSRIEMTDTALDGRKYSTFTTGANDIYLLLWFFTGASGWQNTFNTIQINKGNTLYDYVSYRYTEPDEVMETSRLYGDTIRSELLPSYMYDLLGYRPLGMLDKGYICLVADDGTSDIENVSFVITRNKHVPITFALWTNSACVTDSDLFEQLQEVIADEGCAVCQHGGGSFVNDYTPEALVSYLESEKAAWQQLGITVNGMAYPNHDNNSYVRTICGAMYDVACTGGSAANKQYVYPNDTLGQRSNMFALYRISTASTTLVNLKAACDYALANNKLLILFWHDNSVAADQNHFNKLTDIIDYAVGLGLQFVTVNDIKNLN